MDTKISFKPLDKAIEIMEKADFELGYFYDDLVFARPAIFLFRFDDADSGVFHVHFNTETDTESYPDIFNLLQKAAKDADITCKQGETFTITPLEDREEFSLAFNG